MASKAWRAVVPLAVAGAIAFAPVPDGLTPNAWRYFAIFAAVIVALVLEPIPAAAVGVIGVTVATSLLLVETTPSGSIRWALSGFSNSTVWFIFAAFMLATGYEKTGLGRRLGLALIAKLGRKTLGLGYAVALFDLVLAPVLPSNTARSGGTIFPIIKNIPPLLGSTPEQNPRKIGSYLMWTAIASTCVTSSMFLTALAPNVLALSLLQKIARIDITWTEWCVGFLPAGLLLLLAVPYLVYRIYPPTMKSSEGAHRWARVELGRMGKATVKEYLMAGLAVLSLLLWIFARDLLDPAAVAMIVLSLMLLTGIIGWEDVVGHRQAWDIFIWFGTLLALAEGLNTVGFLRWVAEATARSLAGVPVTMLVVLFAALFFLAHYLFAGITAHTAALLPVVLTAAMAIPGVPMKQLAMLLCYTLGLMAILTPYASGLSPIYYGSNYVRRAHFWQLGLAFGGIFLAVTLLICVPYLRYLYP
ncbi:MAG: DASS family sodium-coupled anion symporter [Verrucomicrobiota bacterium]